MTIREYIEQLDISNPINVLIRVPVSGYTFGTSYSAKDICSIYLSQTELKLRNSDEFYPWLYCISGGYIKSDTSIVVKNDVMGFPVLYTAPQSNELERLYFELSCWGETLGEYRDYGGIPFDDEEWYPVFANNITKFLFATKTVQPYNYHEFIEILTTAMEKWAQNTVLDTKARGVDE